MSYKVGVFAEGQLSEEAVSETKKVLQELAEKYNCRFELKSVADKAASVSNKIGKLKTSLKPKSNHRNGIYLSFGGELEF